MKKIIPVIGALFLFLSPLYSQQAVSTIPVSIGMPCGAGEGITDSIMYFNYNKATAAINRFSACRPNLAWPGISPYNTSISFNPADGYLYFVRYGWFGSYIWRWDPNTCPGDVPVYQHYPDQAILGLDFDASGVGYQIIFTGSSAPYGLALQRVDFSTGTFGPIQNIDLQGKQIMTQNGDMIITSSNQFLMVWDNLYFSLNYEDYNTATPLKATYISTIALSGSTKLVGLAYAQGKLVGSASDCGYYDFNLITGKLVNLTEGPGLQWSTDMTNITSGVGAAKKLVSASPVSTSVYDLVYDIKIQNFGDFPVSNLQVREDLTTMHTLGSLAVSNVTTEWVNNPAGLVLNSSFNGVTDKNLLASSPAQTLPVFPKVNSTAILRLKFRFSSVVTGTTYYNNVMVTGRGYNNVSLQDSSTNGSDPDLNSNNRPDDVGEDQPTPFSISVSSETPPCNNISTILYKQDFGSGNSNTTALPTGITTEYNGGSNPLDEERYMFTSNAYNANTTKFLSLTDHTGNTNGKMMVINADVNNYKMFEDKVNVTCSNVKYSLIVYAANVMNDEYNTICDGFGGTKQPKLAFIVRDAVTNSIIANSSTDDITSRSWNAYGMKWVMPSGVTSVKIQVYNIAEGGCGNAVALDDIQFGICDPSPVVSAALANAGCPGNGSTLLANLSDTTGMSSYIQYQWQTYSNVITGWTNILGAVSNKYDATVISGLSDQPSFRIIIASNGNMGNTSCQYTSNSIKLTPKDSSTKALNVISNKAFACPGEPVTLTVNGGSLGTNAAWEWRQQNCSGTLLGKGSSIIVYPLATTSYYVRAAGDCNVTQCSYITMPQLCILANESVTLRGSLNGQNANLVIGIVADKKIKSYEIERSTNGVDFTTVRTENINDYVNREGYSFKDAVSGLRENIIYYRIKVSGLNGEEYFSKVLQLSRNGNDFNTTVSPNPATVTTKVSFTSAAASKVEIRLYNTQGQVVRKENVMSVEGLNNYVLTGLDRLAAGMYTVTVTDAGKTSHTKLVIQR